MKMGPTCLHCLFQKQFDKITGLHECIFDKSAYLRDLMKLMSESEPDITAPSLSTRIARQYEHVSGKKVSYAAIKHRYNQLMLGKEEEIRSLIKQQADPLATAIRFARVGNYIDFSMLTGVDDSLLEKMLREALDQELCAAEYANMCAELEKARRLVYLTDNCGEVVMDKLLIEQMITLYPSLKITVLVRGEEAVNDVTMEDAEECGLTTLVPCFGNGSDIPGTSLPDISDHARSLLENADLIISKGQGNFETLCGCGLNVYYLFLCKCDWFVHLFEVPRNTAMLLNEHRVPDICLQ